MAQPSDFYGNAKAVPVTTGKPSLDLPANQQTATKAPVHFWIAMVGLLVVARVLYELAESE